MSETRLRVLSLGAGVQSTTLALLAAHRVLEPMPDCAIFADTGDEPEAVYRHLQWLAPRLPFPVHVVRSAGRLSEAALAGKDAGRIPFYFSTRATGRRQCTKTFKLAPIRRRIRELLGVGPRGRVPDRACETWIGISTDEVFRITPAKVRFVENRYPLIERRMSRGDCLEWLRRNGYPEPPKSACVFCPYQSNRQFRQLRDESPADWQRAVDFDRALRTPEVIDLYRGAQYVHRSARPLAEVDLSTAEDHGQLNLFNNECEGMCGV
jgi:hypothetical protein